MGEHRPGRPRRIVLCIGSVFESLGDRFDLRTVLEEIRTLTLRGG